MMKTCKIKGCFKKHHAKGYCNRHYTNWKRYGNPLHNEPENRTHTPAAEPAAPVMDRRPLKPRIEGVNNVSYQLNIKMIEKLYVEAVKSTHEPLYKGVNGQVLNHILTLAIYLAGCQQPSRLFIAELIDELKTWAEAKDKVRFMDTLENWQKRADAFESQNAKQLNLFSLK